MRARSDSWDNKKSLGMRLRSLSFLFGDESELKLSDIIVCLASAALLLLLAFLKLNKWVGLIVYVLLYALCVLQLAKNAVYRISTGEFFCTETVLLLATLISMLVGGYTGAVAAAILYRAAVLVYTYYNSRYEQALGALSDTIPAKIRLEIGGELKEVSPRGVDVGSIIVVNPGEVIPLDGIVVSGMTSVSMDKLGGNSGEIAIAKNSFVCAGCINQGKQIKIQTTAAYTDIYASKLTDLIAHAYLSPSRFERYAAKFKRYFPTACTLLALLYFVSAGVKTGAWLLCLSRAATIMAIGSAAAIGVSIPLAYACCVANLSKHGVIVKKNCFVQDLAETHTVVFGKNGILTDGRYVVYDVLSEEGVDVSKLLSVAITAYSKSKTMVAAALRASGKSADLSIGNVKMEIIKEQPNVGIHVRIGSSDVHVGAPQYIRALGLDVKIYDKPGMMILCVVVDGRYCGQITMADKMRPGAYEMVDVLHLNGVGNVVMLTGENARIAKQTAESLNFDMVKSELDGEQKKEALSFLMNNKNTDTALAYIGNFRTDAELMAIADIGISIKSFGSEAALEAADVCILGDDISKVADIIATCKTCGTISLMNFGLVACEKLLLLILAASGTIGLTVAVLVDALVYAAAMYNCARLLSNIRVINRK